MDSFPKELDEMRKNSELQIAWLQCLCLNGQLVSTCLKAFRKGRMNYEREVAPEAGSLNCAHTVRTVTWVLATPPTAQRSSVIPDESRFGSVYWWP